MIQCLTPPRAGTAPIPEGPEPGLLRLGYPIAVNQGRQLRLIVRDADSNKVYELQFTPQLRSVPWGLLQRGFLGQTNFVVPATNVQGFLRLRLPALAPVASLILPEDTSRPLPPIHLQLPTNATAKLTLTVNRGGLESDLTHEGIAAVDPGGRSIVVSGAAVLVRSLLTRLRYRPGSNYFGPDRLALRLEPAPGSVRDFEAETDSIPITVTPVDDPPVTTPDSFRVEENTTLLIAAPGILANDTDIENAPLSATLVNGPAHGALALDPAGSLVYLPDADYVGSDRFLYAASDGEHLSEPTPVEILVTPSHSPVAVRITSPVDGALLLAGHPVPLVAEILAAPGLVEQVDYWSGPQWITTAVAPDFSGVWSNPTAGRHDLVAKATEPSGRTVISPLIRVTVESDCDGDGLSDAAELSQGTDPCGLTKVHRLRLQILSGNFQSATPSTVLTNVVAVRLSDPTGAARSEEPVSFTIVSGDPTLALAQGGPWATTSKPRTDSAGVARLWLKAPTAAGRLGVIRVSATNAQADLLLVTTALGPQPGWTFADRPVAVAAGGQHSLALLASGTVWAWGANQAGQLGPGISPVAVPFSTLPLPVPSLSNIVAIAAGAWHSMALRTDGLVVAWGSYAESYPATPPGDLAGVIAIAAGEGHSLALLQDGTVRAWGDPFTRFTPPATLAQVTAIAAGSGFSLALRSGGTVAAWGLGPFHNNYGQINVPAGLRNVRAIAAGGEHSLALLTNGTVVGWGANYDGQATPPAGLTNVVSIAAGFAHSVALRVDGTLVAWGDDSFGQVGRLAEFRNVTAIQAGGDLDHSHNILIWRDSLVWCSGSNSSGELGDGTQTDRLLPVAVSELPTYHTLTNPVPFELYTPLR